MLRATFYQFRALFIGSFLYGCSWDFVSWQSAASLSSQSASRVLWQRLKLSQEPTNQRKARPAENKMNCLNVPEVTPGSPSKNRGQIQVIFGPMFSGKSTELIRRVRRFQIAQYRCLVVKYDKDVRYDANRLATHDRNTMEAVTANRLRDIYQQALNSCVIGIDEGQFFPDTVEFCEEMANLGKTVIVAALDGTFQRKAFGSILSLVPLAESVVKLNSVCMECYREAAYTKRLGAEKEVEVIGGSDKYHAVCRRCYFRKQNLQSGYDGKENMTLGVPVPIQKVKQRASSTPRKLFAQLQLQ